MNISGKDSLLTPHVVVPDERQQHVPFLDVCAV
jgi:hypothetical protein